MNDNNQIHIVSATDNGYVQHLGVVYASLLANLSPGRPVKFHVIDGGISPSNKLFLENAVSRGGGHLEWLNLQTEAYEDLFVRNDSQNHITKTAYYRLDIPGLIQDNGIDKVIYLDCDMLVLGDIAELWDTKLDGYCLGAVTDLGGEERLADLGIPPEFKYFNSGVLLIPLQEWRNADITSRVLRFLRDNHNRLYYHDQDGLNGILYASWKELPPRWNVQRNMMSKPKTRLFPAGALKEAVRKPAIIHFTGSSKPWQYDNNHPYKDSYYKYLSMTDWHAYKPEVGPKLIAKRIARVLLPEPVLTLITKLVLR